VHQPLAELVTVVGVGHATCPVAVVLVHQPDLEKQVVEHQEEQAPLDKGHIEALEPLLAEGPRVLQVLLVKEVARRDKEHRHVEQVDKCYQQVRPLGMSCTHQYNGYRLTNRQISIISFHVKPHCCGSTKVATFLESYPLTNSFICTK